MFLQKKKKKRIFYMATKIYEENKYIKIKILLFFFFHFLIWLVCFVFVNARA